MNCLPLSSEIQAFWTGNEKVKTNAVKLLHWLLLFRQNSMVDNL